MLTTHEIKAPLCKGGSREAGGGLRPCEGKSIPGQDHNLSVSADALPPAYASDPSVAARHLPTLWGVTLYTREALSL